MGWKHSSYIMKTNSHAYKKVKKALDKKRKKARAAMILVPFM